MNHLLGDDAIGALQGGFDIALARSQFVSDVVAEAFMNHRAALSCGFDIHNRREFFVININQMHRVGSRVLVSRHDGRCHDKRHRLLRYPNARTHLPARQ